MSPKTVGIFLLAGTFMASVPAGLTGCSATKPTPEVSVSAGGYAAAFDAARETLRAHSFELERVDAASGVITSAPKASAGIATPWDRDQSTLMQEADDLLNHQRRRVRITFTDVVSGAAPDPAQPVHVVVAVYVDRVQSPGLRVPATAPTLWSTAQDPARTQQGIGSAYVTPVARDTKFERRLAAEIERRMAATAGPATASAQP
jgi:hypothetical protein